MPKSVILGLLWLIESIKRLFMGIFDTQEPIKSVVKIKAPNCYLMGSSGVSKKATE